MSRVDVGGVLNQPIASTFDAAQKRCYIADAGAGAIYVVTMSTGATSLVASVASPVGIALDPGADTLFVPVGGGSPSLQAIYLPTLVWRRVDTAGTITNPAGVAVNNVGFYAYVTDLSAKALYRVAITGGAVTRVDTGSVFQAPTQVTLNDISTKAFVADSTNNHVYQVNLLSSAGTVGAVSILEGAHALTSVMGVATNWLSNPTQLWLAAGSTGGVYKVALPTGTPTRVDIGGTLVAPRSLQLSADGTTLWVIDSSNVGLWAVSLGNALVFGPIRSTSTLGATLPSISMAPACPIVGGLTVTLGATSGTLSTTTLTWPAGSWATQRFTLIAPTSALTVTLSFSLSGADASVSQTPPSRSIVVSAYAAVGTLSTLDSLTMSAGSISPGFIALSRDQSIAYVTDTGRNTITMVNTHTGAASVLVNSVPSNAGGVYLSPNEKTLYVSFDVSSVGTIIAVDIGAQTWSTLWAGAPLATIVGMQGNRAGTRLYVVDKNQAGLFKVTLKPTVAVTRVDVGNVMSGNLPYDVSLNYAETYAYCVGDHSTAGNIYSINLSTGATTNIYASGGTLTQARGILVNAAASIAWVSQYGVSG